MRERERERRRFCVFFWFFEALKFVFFCVLVFDYLFDVVLFKGFYCFFNQTTIFCFVVKGQSTGETKLSYRPVVPLLLKTCQLLITVDPLKIKCLLAGLNYSWLLVKSTVLLLSKTSTAELLSPHCG